MDRFDRLALLYNQLGLSTEVGTINRGEIKGYCAGMRMLDDIIGVTIDDKMISKHIDATHSNFDSAARECTEFWWVTGNRVVLTNVDVDKVGVFANDWLSPFRRIICNGDGWSWDMFCQTWIELDNRQLKWSMIDTMEDNNG